ncbi:FecR domain-containing protein [Pseudomonas phoenicis]|uniref:FecR domain-containing protein n=1 Tax=unclassified Pseudomonas TaxID=196821 RepID=UPI0039A1B61B
MSPMPALQHQSDPDQDALEWFALLQHPDCDIYLRQAFDAWRSDSVNAQAYARLEARLHRLQPVPVQARPRPQVMTLRKSRLGICLGMLFILSLTALAYLYWPWAQRQASQLHTDAGERRTVRLSEGSTLHLDSASAMNLDLRGRVRHLQLVQGQVSLEVNLDGRELDVQVGEARIQVFGTRLLIARHADHDEVQVLNGKAVVQQNGEQRLVSTGERLTFDGQGLYQAEKIDTKTADAWRQGHLIAKDLPLGRVLERLASYQGQRLWLLDEQTAHRQVSGDFDLDRPADTLQRLAADQRLQLHDVLGQWLLVR